VLEQSALIESAGAAATRIAAATAETTVPLGKTVPLADIDDAFSNHSYHVEVTVTPQ
jgi:hypothetical protein